MFACVCAWSYVCQLPQALNSITFVEKSQTQIFVSRLYWLLDEF